MAASIVTSICLLQLLKTFWMQAQTLHKTLTANYWTATSLFTPHTYSQSCFIISKCRYCNHFIYRHSICIHYWGQIIFLQTVAFENVVAVNSAIKTSKCSFRLQAFFLNCVLLREMWLQ